MVTPERQAHPMHGHLDDIILVLSGINMCMCACGCMCLCMCVCACVRFAGVELRLMCYPVSPQLYKTLKGEARQAVNSFSVSGELTWENRCNR